MKKILCIILMGCLMASAVGCSSDSQTTDGKAADELGISREEKDEKNEDNDEKDNDKSEKDGKNEEEQKDDNDTEIDKGIKTEDMHVYDEAELFDEAKLDDINSYCAWLAKTFKINVAVATTSDIGDSEPSDYAKHVYESNYSGDGILFLINNDTGNDYFYRRGVPSKFISDSNIQMLFSEISPMLAMEDYSAAAGLALEEAEERLPQYFTDRTGNIEKDTISELNKHIEENAGENSINVYYVVGIGDDSIEDFAKKRFEMFYDDSENAAMLVINGENGENFLNTSGSMKYLEESSSDINKAVKSCYSKNNGMDLENAVKKFMGFVE